MDSLVVNRWCPWRIHYTAALSRGRERQKAEPTQRSWVTEGIIGAVSDLVSFLFPFSFLVLSEKDLLPPWHLAMRPSSHRQSPLKPGAYFALLSSNCLPFSCLYHTHTHWCDSVSRLGGRGDGGTQNQLVFIRFSQLKNFTNVLFFPSILFCLLSTPLLGLPLPCLIISQVWKRSSSLSQ